MVVASPRDAWPTSIKFSILIAGFSVILVDLLFPVEVDVVTVVFSGTRIRLRLGSSQQSWGIRSRGIRVPKNILLSSSSEFPFRTNIGAK